MKSGAVIDEVKARELTAHDPFLNRLTFVETKAPG